MIHRPYIFSVLLAGTALLAAGCSIAPPITPQETQIKSDLDVENFLPATRQMRDAIETQELFAQAAFWSNEYHLNPSDLEAALKLSSAVRRLGNPGRAVEITQTTRALYPRDPYLIAEYGAALIATERSYDAIPILNEGISTTPNYGRLWSLKGAALDQQERYAEARQHYDRALRITPNDPNVMANIGLSHALSGDPATAEGWLRRAANLPNASDSVRQNLIHVLQLQGKTAEAQNLSNSIRPQNNFPSVRPAHNPAPVAAQARANPLPLTKTNPGASSPQNFQAQGFQPQARLQTSTPQGQQFKSASEAVRAIAAKRAGQPAPQGRTSQVYAQTAPSQPAAAKPQAYPPQAYPQQNYAQQQAAPQGAYAPNSQPDRRAPNRRRR